MPARGNGGGRTGLLGFWLIVEWDSPVVPIFAGSLLKEFLDGTAARFKELGVVGDKTLFDGLPEAFNESLGAAHS